MPCSNSRPEPFLAVIFGSLFYSYSAKPSLEVQLCNYSKCRRSSSLSPDSFTYYFPTWMMRTVLMFSIWKDLNGKNASWMIRAPREISEVQPCWDFINKGRINQIRELLSKHAMSPFDIDR